MKHSRLQIVSTPMVVSGLVTLTLLLGAASGSASASPVEVLYVTEPQASKAVVATYNVNPLTAVAVKVGPTITVEGSSVTPLSIGIKHVIYVWNATQVWTYVTDSQGVPNTQPSQHLTFRFPFPVIAFLANPNGKFAYAATSNGTEETIVLFTINQTTGKLTNTNKVVARFGPNFFVALTAFSFGRTGRKMWALELISGGHACFVSYDYYPVNQTNGELGSLVRGVVGFDCSFAFGGVAFSDETAAYAENSVGPGGGVVGVIHLATGQTIICQTAMQTFCGDEPFWISLDPSGQNLFFADRDTLQVSIGHIDWTNLNVVLSPSIIPGTPAPLFFSPDSKLVYAVNATDIGIYALQSSSGNLTASTLLPISGSVSVATATLR
jgi:hypothetical protein